jgi:2-keto-myo-inositol isomerase
MELCYNLQTCIDGSSLESQLALCHQVGFTQVELTLATVDRYLEKHSEKELGNLLQQYKLSCASINAIFDINFCSEKKWMSITKQFLKACQFANCCHSDTVIVLSSERLDLPENCPAESIFNDTVGNLSRLADLGAPLHIKIAFEPVGTMAIGDISTAKRIIEKVNRTDVGLVLDPFNLYLWDLGTDFPVISTIDPKKIFIVHMNDAEKIPFALLTQEHRCMPGDGRIDLACFMKGIRLSGYDGAISMEVLNPTIWSRGIKEVIPLAYRRLADIVNRCWSM